MRRAARRCRYDGKHTFTSYQLAEKAGNALPDKPRIYWCPQGGGYHITRLDAAEYDQRRAAGDADQADAGRTLRP